MRKPFERFEVEALDDGSFSIRVYPVPKKSKKDAKDGPCCVEYNEPKKMTAMTSEDLAEKVQELCAVAGAGDFEKMMGTADDDDDEEDE
jgi:hypothetical protein